ncbi:MAG: hypothetical protein ABIF09_02170 [Gemmatimonadota bacterium]
MGENVRENMNRIGFIRDDDRREVDSNIKKQFWINRKWRLSLSNDEEFKAKEPGLYEKDFRNTLYQADLTFDTRTGKSVSAYYGKGTNFDSDLERETTQFVYVWRILPPFGSLQLAYQQGPSQVGDESGTFRTVFTKLSWVF